MSLDLIGEQPSGELLEFPLVISARDLKLNGAILKERADFYRDDPAFEEFYEAIMNLMYALGFDGSEFGASDEYDSGREYHFDNPKAIDNYIFLVKIDQDFVDLQTLHSMDPNFPLDTWVNVSYDEYRFFVSCTFGASGADSIVSYSVKGLTCKALNVATIDLTYYRQYHPELAEILEYAVGGGLDDDDDYDYDYDDDMYAYPRGTYSSYDAWDD